MAVFDVDKAINSSDNPKKISLHDWCGYKSRKECTGVVNRGVASALGVNLYCGSPRYVAQWVYENGGNNYYSEVDPKQLLTNPQYGDIVIYRSKTSGATHSSSGPFYKAGEHIGHTIMWLPNPKTGSGATWVSDFIQSKWYVYGSSQFEYLRAFRLKISYSWKGQTYQSSTLPEIPNPGYYGGLTGSPSDLQSAAGSTDSGPDPSAATDGTTPDSSMGGGATVVAGGSSYIRGQNYGGRSIKEGNPNTVYQLSSFYQRNDVLQLSSARKGEFEKMRQSMIDQTPNRERTIITSDELYQPSILKTTQRSKQDRTATQIRNKNGESS